VTVSNDTISVAVVSITHCGSRTQFVTMLKSPGRGARLFSASKPQTKAAVARFVPARTKATSSFASGSLSPK
jgi:hypothetical protein